MLGPQWPHQLGRTCVDRAGLGKRGSSPCLCSVFLYLPLKVVGFLVWLNSTILGSAVTLNGMGGGLRLLPDVVLEALVSNRVLPGEGAERGSEALLPKPQQPLCS